jgi:hypothetical protein
MGLDSTLRTLAQPLGERLAAEVVPSSPQVTDARARLETARADLRDMRARQRRPPVGAVGVGVALGVVGFLALRATD